MIEIIRSKFGYEHWANARSLESIRTLPVPVEKSQRWLGHIVLAHRFWFMRLQNEKPPKVDDMFPLHGPDELAGQIEGLRTLWADYIAEMSEERLRTVISYQTNKGQPFSSPVLDILLHVTNHSTYHRGQIASSVRENGGTPLPLDYIIFKRGG